MRGFPNISIRGRTVASIHSRRFARALITFIVIFLGYAVISDPRLHIVARPEFLPQYRDIFGTLWFVLSTGLLQTSTVESTSRMLQGYAIGSVIGVTLGLAMGLSKKMNFALHPLLQFVRFTPAMAFMPLYALWFGMGEFSKILLIATGVSVVVWIGAFHGVKDIPDVYIKAAQVTGAGKMLLLRKVILPAAMPHIFASLRLAVATAWTIIVAAELMGGVGLGYLLSSGREWINVKLIFIVIVSIGLLVFIMDSIAKAVHERVTGWMKRVGE